MFLDIVARAAETDAGWAVISGGDGLESLIETGILPFLRLRPRDVALWEEDEDEYVRLHVESKSALGCTLFTIVSYGNKPSVGPLYGPLSIVLDASRTKRPPRRLLFPCTAV